MTLKVQILKKLTVKNMVSMCFDIDILVKSLNTLRNELDNATYEKKQILIYINIPRVCTISFFYIISVFSFSQLIEPYIKLHEDQNEMKINCCWSK